MTDTGNVFGKRKRKIAFPEKRKRKRKRETSFLSLRSATRRSIQNNHPRIPRTPRSNPNPSAEV